MSEYDQRQYRLMLGVLERFAQNKESLQSATGSLGILADVLEENDDAWQRLFGSFWNKMEIENAQAIAHGMVTDEALRHAHEAAAKLKELVLQKIEEPSDPN
jgi:hypothetical protein